MHLVEGGSTKSANQTGYSLTAVQLIRRLVQLIHGYASHATSEILQSLELSGDGEESTANDDQSRVATPGLTTVIVPPARTQELTAAQNKKNRDREYQRKKRANARRSAGTISDDESVTSGRRPTKRARMADGD